MKSWFRSLPFFALFPGYFAYNWAALNGWIGLVLGGYANEVSALVCVGFILALSISLIVGREISVRLNIVDACFALFMAWFGVTILFHLMIASAPGVTKNHVASWVQIMACYLAVRTLQFDIVRMPLLWVTVIFTIAVLWAAQTDLLGLLLRGSNDSSAATYQGLARALLITSTFSLFGQRLLWVRWLGYLATLFILFLVGARSEIAGAAILFGVIEIGASRRPMRSALLATVGAAVAAILLLMAVDALAELFPDNRFIALLLEGSNDASAVERSIYAAMAWRAIQESPVLGDYGHYEYVASAGAYAHNWLSVWVDLGLVGLFLFVLLHLIAARTATLNYRLAILSGDSSRKRQAAFGVGLLTMVIIFNLLAKNFTDPGLATAGAFLAAMASAFPYSRVPSLRTRITSVS